MEQIKKTVRAGRIGPGVTDQFYVDEDINIPEAKYDAARVVYSSGRIHVEDIRPAEHYARVTGRLSYQILYKTEDGGEQLSSLAGRLPFEEMVYMEEEPKDQLFVRGATAEVSVTLINSRKMNLKASVDLTIGSEGAEEEQITADMEEESTVYKKFSEREILELCTVQKDVYRIKEEIHLPAARENIGTLLLGESALRKLDTRLEDGGLVLRGELQVFCLYESQNMKTEWVEQSVPFEGRLSCEGAGEEMYHCVYASLGDDSIEARLDEDGEVRIFGVEASLEVRCTVYREEKIRILEDLYAPGRKLTPEREEVILESLVMQNHSKCRLTEQLSLPEIREGTLQICHSSGFLQMEPAQIQDGEIRAEGVLNVMFLYVRADDEQPFGIWQGMVPFSHSIECSGASEEMRCDIEGSLEQLSVSLLGNGEAEVKAALSFQVFLRKPERVDNILDVSEQPVDAKELENAPGIVGYIVKEGDTLWDLARRYNTTEEGIREVNDIKEGTLRPGDRLLIFKENMGIL